jgi:SAM-dependent methyltransferase
MDGPLDLAPENIADVEQRVAGWALDCPVSTRVGSFLDLPFADDSFDAVWCANSSQYLSDAELETMLTEFRRVVRPGGMVAIKEANGAIWNYVPRDPGRTWRFLDATRETEPQIHGILRTPDLRRWLEAAGYQEVWQRATLIERWAPLRSSERQYFGEIFQWMAHVAEGAVLSEDDHAFWRGMQDTDASAHPLNQTDFSTFDAQTVVVGRVPGSS